MTTILLGPQRFTTTVGATVRSLGLDGPIAVINSGWEERESDDAELSGILDGRARNLHLARFGDFGMLRPCEPVDLLVCSDVLHYLPTRELDRGLPGLAELCGGVAFLEAFAREDRAVGDEHDFQQRPAAFYRKRFEALGFAQLGSHCWLSPALRERATALEISA